MDYKKTIPDSGLTIVRDFVQYIQILPFSTLFRKKVIE